MTLLDLSKALGGTLVAYALWKITSFVITRRRSPLHNLPGPKSANWFWGNINQILKSEDLVHEKWVGDHGQTIMYYGLLEVSPEALKKKLLSLPRSPHQIPRLCTLDVRALNHIIMHVDDYEKPEETRYNLSRILGEGVWLFSLTENFLIRSIGLLFVEGAKHKQQVSLISLSVIAILIPKPSETNNGTYPPHHITLL